MQGGDSVVGAAVFVGGSRSSDAAWQPRSWCGRSLVIFALCMEVEHVCRGKSLSGFGPTEGGGVCGHSPWQRMWA